MDKSAFTRVILCADDYAQNEGIDSAVHQLLDLGRLSAVSCFSTAPHWQDTAAPALREHLGQADIGLHFNLTEGFGKTDMPGLHAVIVCSLMRRMHPARLRQELERQLNAFEAGFGQPPDFIDGHQHVHQLPGVRTVVLKMIQDRYPGHPVWIRNTVPANPQWRGKALILKHLGGRALATSLQAARMPTNNGFGGVYGFDREDYAACFKAWLQAATDGMLIMCHPGATPYPGDAIGRQRVVEYRFFRSPECRDMLDAAGVRLARLSQIGMGK